MLPNNMTGEGMLVWCVWANARYGDWSMGDDELSGKLLSGE
jgi:hypothetical protein